MAVVVKYVVVRENGVEKKTFTSKKEADAYDKLLDIADAVSEYLEAAVEVELSTEQREGLGYALAMDRDAVIKLLKSGQYSPDSEQDADD